MLGFYTEETDTDESEKYMTLKKGVCNTSTLLPNLTYIGSMIPPPQPSTPVTAAGQFDSLPHSLTHSLTGTGTEPATPRLEPVRPAPDLPPIVERPAHTISEKTKVRCVRLVLCSLYSIATEGGGRCHGVY